MKLADITILESEIPPYFKCKKPSKITLSFLSTLINDSGFCQEVADISDEYGIKRPTSIRAFKNETINIMNFYDFMKGSLDGLLVRYSLPNGYRFRLFLLIVFHAFIDIPEDEGPDIVYLSNPSDIAKYTENLEEELERVSAIAFGSSCTKKELIDWINGNWKDIKKDMEVSLPVRLKLGKVYKNVSLAQQAYELRKDGKTYEEISDYLMEKYPNDKKICDPAWLKTAVSRHLQKNRKFSRKFPPLD